MAGKTYNGLPLFEASIEDGDQMAIGMIRISLVDYPAVESDFVKFAKNDRPMMYAVQDEEKRIVRGVVMRAGFPIYRNDPEWGEYYTVYNADTVREMAEKYLFDGRQNDVNLMHEQGTDVEGVNMVQFFIKDSAKGVNPEGFEEIEDGSLFAEFHVQNDVVWEQIKSGEYKGFSLEGRFFFNRAEESQDYSVIDKVFTKLFKTKSMSKKKLTIITDFATSGKSLENAEKLIRKAFKEEIPNTTKIIIAQTIASVEDADKIIVFENGEVNGFGTHEELLKTNAIYKEVYDSQVKGGEDNE